MQAPSPEWEGLTSRTFECAAGKSTHAFEIPHSLLILHVDGGRSCAIRSNGVAGKHVTRAGRFDYLPSGRYETIVGAPTATRELRVEIPVAFENSVAEEGRWRRQLSPRFQFQDRRLDGLVHSLVLAAASNVAAPDAVLLSVAVVDRLYETALPAAAADRAAKFTSTVQRLIGEYIDEDIGSAIDVDKVAFLTGLARTQFAKLFRDSFGMPLHQYILTRKIEVASRRLLGDVRVTELSHELGFSSHAHFSTVFRLHVGMTPSEFRKHRAAQADLPMAV